jgi:hypothetical protein
MILRAVHPGRVAIEQFDASATRRLLGFGAGWHEQEFNPATGVRWRWLSERGHLSITSGAQPTRRSILHVEGESPLKYFSRASTLTVRVGREATFDFRLSSDFSIDVPIGTESGDIVLETDQTYVPADRSLRRSADRRRLGLRIFKCEIRPAGAQP